MTIENKMMREEVTIDSSPNKPDATGTDGGLAAVKKYESQPSDEREVESAPSIKSDFRQSLEDEAKEKERQRAMEEQRLQQSKKLLREGIDASSNSLTRPTEFP